MYERKRARRIVNVHNLRPTTVALRQVGGADAAWR
jgi:hypothetical protein